MKRHLLNWLWILPLLVMLPTWARPDPSMSGTALGLLTDGAGLWLVFTGVVIRICARGWKHENSDGRLVITGLYWYVRHPLYVGSFLMGLGLTLILGHAWFIVLYAVLFAASHSISIRSEEAYLSRQWPRNFGKYRQRVRAFIPKLRRLRQRKRVVPHRLWEAICREADAVCLWPMAAVLLRRWEVQSLPGSDSQRLGLELTGLCLVIGWVALRLTFRQMQSNATADGTASKQEAFASQGPPKR